MKDSNFSKMSGTSKSTSTQPLSETCCVTLYTNHQGPVLFTQDRLYEIDKSWKNNVVLFGVPLDADSSNAAVEEDPMVTEEKVIKGPLVPQNVRYKFQFTL